jgi:ABC-2 type transport system ATP-binding protein
MITMTVETILSVEHLTKTFGSLQAVNDLNFNIQKGEIVGFLGPNGAGKTTSIRLITGIFPMDGNECIKLFGQNVVDEPEKYKNQIGIVPEISNAFSDLTVMQNILFSGGIYGLSQSNILKRADELLQRYNLSEKRDSIVKTLSKGLKQRLNFILALLHHPTLLILDEPTSGLDPLSVKLLRENITDLKAEGKSILITTHDLREAQNLCDRVLIINRGRLIADESPADLQQRFSQSSKIQFQIRPALDPPTEARWLEQIPLTSSKQGYSILCANPLPIFLKLHSLSEKADVKLIHLSVEESSLEEIFLQLVQSDEQKGGKLQ